MKDMASRSSRPTVHKISMAALVTTSLMIAGGVHAQWRVIDNQLINDTNKNWKTDKQLQEEQKKKLEEMFKQQYVGQAGSSGDLAQEPAEKLDPDRPSLTVDLGESQRCPQSPGPAIAQQQLLLCKEIVKTERAQYTYSLKMYEQTKTRHQRLQDIEQERENIGETEQGKLQDNNNKLLALLSLMEIDRQQQKTYMDAYQARLHYLSVARDTLTRQALGGKAGAGALGGSVGAAVMAEALNAARTRRRFRR